MDITKHNFHEKLDFVLESIKNCAFMAIDGEFTGLSAFDGGHAAPFDTPEERYDKIRMGSTDFLLIQFGLCTFHVDAEKRRYEARPFNFYVFPRPHDRQGPDRRFLCQSSSIDFLVAQGFDFNKLFREGIPYLMPEAEQRLRKNMEQKHDETTKLMSPGFSSPAHKKAQMTIPEEQKSFINKIFGKINTYLDSDETEPLGLPPCNAFQRRLIYQTVEEKFPSVQLETVTGDKKERYMLVSRTKNPEERLKKEKTKQAVEKLELDVQVGFSKVIQAMSESGKLVVGHNMVLDVVHSVNQFHCYLPDDLNDFKSLVRTVFPRLLDTKLMASTNPFKEYIINTSLDEVRLSLHEPPFSQVQIDLPEGFESYKDGGCLHEAGYDAFITGSCFAHMTRFLGTCQKPKDEFPLPTSAIVEPFVNKLFLMRINDIPYLDLKGPDLPPQRDHVFHVTFPKEWKPTDLYTLFHPYGTIQISWLTDSTAYVGLNRKENAETALKHLSKENGLYHVTSYALYQRSKRNFSWSSSETETPKAVSKRKCAAGSRDSPPTKVERYSTSQESVTPMLKKNVSDKNGEQVKDEVSESSKRIECNMSSAKDSGSVLRSRVSSSDDKLFEESDAW